MMSSSSSSTTLLSSEVGTSIVIVKDELIESVQFFVPRPLLFRWDTGPFVLYYAVLFSIPLIQHSYGTAFSYSFESNSPTAENDSEKALLLGSLILIPIGLLLHIAVFLFSQTYPSFQVCIGNVIAPSTRTLIDKQHIVALVKAAPNVGNDRIIKVDTSVRRSSRPGFMVVDLAIAATSAPSASGPSPSEATLLLGRVEFQKVKYDLLLESGSKLTLQRVKYPTAAKVERFLKWTGMGIQSVKSKEVDTVKAALNQWGLNEYDIPIPQFLDLYLNHLVAPFFVFQVLCLFLWSLDDYWIYSAFTLLMLLFFEGMMCRQRQNSLMMLRNMRRPPIPLLVFRYGQWVVLQSDMIVPGDVVSLTATSLTRRRKGQAEAAGDASQGQTVPCDALLLRGSCVVNEAMLTGESVPQMKEPPTVDTSSSSQTAVADIGSDSNIAAEWKRHLVLSGTSLLIHNGSDGENNDNSSIPAPPDRGCVCLVLRTGFGSTQGGLMRKILFARERVGLGSSGSSSETAMFIALLVFFALIAAGWVLRQGLLDERRNVFRLVLHCVLVVTSVVPPELPMELSLAVTNSLAALAKVLVYCTEPFRIAMAGKLDVCCFDKTGTLTQDQMLLKGIVHGLIADRMVPTDAVALSTVEDIVSTAPDEPDVQVMDSSGFADVVLAAMGCCHDLLPPLNNSQSQTLLGDPLELATMGASGFHFDPAFNASASSGMCTVIHEERGLRLTVIHRFPFSSALKRMTVIVHRKEDDSLWVFCKGAPEVLREHMDPKSVPVNFQSTAFYHMSRGKRVLSIAFKKLSLQGSRTGDSLSALLQMVRAKYSRKDLEKNLSFAGFLLFDCDLKADSKGVIRDLKAAQLGVVMITGDSVFTAAEVARKLGIVRGSKEKASKSTTTLTASEVLILHCSRKNDGEVLWRSGEVDGESLEQHALDLSFSADTAAIHNLSIQYSLCVTGPALTALEKSSGPGYSRLLQALAPKVSVFARVSPSQKESILLAMNDAGLGTLMCGDGTNDVGALKAAHVGVSIVNDPAFERRIEGNKKEKGGKGSTAKDRMARAMTELQEQEQDPTLVKLGDASIASPFTCRRTSVDCVLSVIRQGRCTLVTTIQVYKILALNCLVSAYMMSALYLRGLKQGDTQMTASGLVVAALFFLLSQAKPLQAIGLKRPASSVFAPSVALSIVGQVAVHLLSLLAALALCEHHQPSSSQSSGTADGRFQPNLVNSAVFLLSAVMQVNNFVVNYRGDPFTQSLLENIPLLRTVQGLYGCLLLAVGGGLEPLNDLLQLAPFPNKDFQVQLLVILLVNSAAALGVEKLCQRLE